MSKYSRLQAVCPQPRWRNKRAKEDEEDGSRRKNERKKMTNIKTICLNNKLINNKTVMSYTITYECITSTSTSTSDSLHYFYVDFITFVLWCIFIPFSFCCLPLSVCLSAIWLCLSHHRHQLGWFFHFRDPIENLQPKTKANEQPT